MVQISYGGLKTGQICLFYGLKCPDFNGLSNHMIRPFENLKSPMFGLQVFGKLKVTVSGT